MAVVFLSWLENRLCPFWLVRRVWILLAFEAYAYILWVNTTLVSDFLFAVNTLEVASVALNTWLISEHFHEDTCLWRIERSADLSVIASCVEAEVVVDAATCVLNLVEVGTDSLADSCWLAEIEYSAFYRLDFTCWNVESIRRSEVLCIDAKEEFSLFSDAEVIEKMDEYMALVEEKVDEIQSDLHREPATNAVLTMLKKSY